MYVELCKYNLEWFIGINLFRLLVYKLIFITTILNKGRQKSNCGVLGYNDLKENTICVEDKMKNNDNEIIDIKHINQ